MNWQDKGYLLSKNNYSENSAIAEFFTEQHGKITGIIFGATSKKIKNYLLIGNKFHINYSSKFEGKIGSLKLEIDEITTPKFLENKQKLLCILYSNNLIKILTVENQENRKIYNLMRELYSSLDNDNWLVSFVLWELNILSNLGYDIDFNNYVKKIYENNKEKFVLSNNEKEIPKFLIYKSTEINNYSEILLGLKYVGDYLDKSIIKPNNLNFPLSRKEFIDSIKHL